MSTTERLRADIDSGITHDKVRGSDPAAAPLGADEEAAGTPVSREAVQLARSHEVEATPREEKERSPLLYMSVLALVMILLTGGVLYLSGQVQ